MRIVAGIARGINLETPKLENESVRPTLGRVKENFFNAITFDLPGAKVLDLFAGSGQLGLEALSRGAASCAFVDNSAECYEIIKKNAQKCKLYDKCNIYRYEYSEYIGSLKKRKEVEGENFVKFDIVFLDPPYEQSSRFIKECVKRLIKHDLIENNALIICESENNIELEDESAEKIIKTRIYKYGRVIITCLTAGR